MASDKDTIYIDVDDEITGIIDKVQASGGKVVALVLPKRAAVFQSIVNMKLLKRAADGADKNLVLITSEAGLLPLAGVAGIHVAKTLNGKPEIPSAPKIAEGTEEAEEAVDGHEVEEVTAASAGAMAIGDLAGKPPADTGAVETLTLDEDKLPDESFDHPPKPKSFEPPTAKKAKKDKKLKIPDFNRFRVLMVAGVIFLIALIVFLFLAIKVLPKATITLHTDAQKFDSNLTLNLSTEAKSLDPTTSTVPAKLEQTKKTYSQSVATTGQTNNGNKARGTVTMTATECAPNLGTPDSVPAGTGLSSNGQTYITQEATEFSGNPGPGNGSCNTYTATSTTDIVAQSGGSSYNNATSFTVAGRSDVSVQVSSAVTGGTDKIVQSVNQNDINDAKNKINTNDPTVKQSLEDQLQQEGWFVIKSSYNATTPVMSTSANVGDVANNVTVTETVTYTVYGVHKDDLKTLVDNDVDTQIDTSKQKVLDEGLDSATFNIVNSSGSGAQVVMDTKAVAGPDLNIDSIKQDAEGKRSGEIKDNLSNNPDIKSVDVNLSPFWVTTAPKNINKIKVVIAEPKTVSNSNASNH